VVASLLLLLRLLPLLWLGVGLGLGVRVVLGVVVGRIRVATTAMMS
jgi:hypothetical protein